MNAIEKLKALEAAATPRPWERSSMENEEFYGDWEWAGPGGFTRAEDAGFTAKFRDLAFEILAVLEAADDYLVNRGTLSISDAMAVFHARAAEVLK